MRKLLLLGWRAADWAMINPLMDRGDMPHLQRVVNNGVVGPLASIAPRVAPMLWTSMVTGKTADHHGILGALEPDPLSGGARATASTSRTCKALWTILDEQGLRPHIVNWSASHPAEPLRGVSVSEAMCAATESVPSRAVHPSHLETTLAALRVMPRDLTGTDLSLFVPAIDSIDQQHDLRLNPLARHVSEGLTAHAAATWILEHESWDFLAVQINTIARLAETFMAYHPPRMTHVSEEDFDTYREVMTGVYRMHDLMLGRLLDLAGPDATVMIVSEHGHASGADRPQKSHALPVDNPALWVRPHGIFCVSGPGIRKDDLVHGAGLLDVAPTVLTLFELPLASDMPGRPLLEAFEDTPALRHIPSWEATDAGRNHLDHSPDESQLAAEAISHLSALGYLDAASKDLLPHREGAIRLQQVNLAHVHLANGRPQEAIALLEGLLADHPDDLSVQLSLAEAHFKAGNYDQSEGLAFLLVGRGEDRPLVRLLHANTAMSRGDTARALGYLAAVEQSEAVDARLSMMTGQGYLRLHRAEDAERQFRRALEIDGRLAGAWRGLTTALLAQKKHQEAAAAAMEAVGFDYANGNGHYLLGVALACSGRLDRAVNAFETCVRVQPQAVQAHRCLDRIHTHVTRDHERALYHRERASELTPAASARQPAASSG
jgi:predicted AlkP superfamily phosphohydrolase/phosphomutase/tetratricopeptide (TPR) repeat protein